MLVIGTPFLTVESLTATISTVYAEDLSAVP